MQAPLIHLNGSGAKSLLDGYCAAWEAVHEAIRALTEAGPNKRDYYPLGDAAWRAALAEHLSRLERLQTVYDELAALAAIVADDVR